MVTRTGAGIDPRDRSVQRRRRGGVRHLPACRRASRPISRAATDTLSAPRRHRAVAARRWRRHGHPHGRQRRRRARWWAGRRHADRRLGRRRLLRRDRQRHDRRPRRHPRADLVRRRHGQREQRLHRHPRRLRTRQGRRRRRLQRHDDRRVQHAGRLQRREPGHLPGRPGSRGRHRRGLRRAGRPQPRPRRRRLPRARPTATTPTARYGPTRSRSAATRRRELRPARRSLRGPAVARVDQLAHRSALHPAAQAGGAQRPGGRTRGRLLQRAGLHAAPHTHGDRAAEPRARVRAAFLRPRPVPPGRPARLCPLRRRERSDGSTRTGSSAACCRSPRSSAGRPAQRRGDRAEAPADSRRPRRAPRRAVGARRRLRPRPVQHQRLDAELRRRPDTAENDQIAGFETPTSYRFTQLRRPTSSGRGDGCTFVTDSHGRLPQDGHPPRRAEPQGRRRRRLGQRQRHDSR